MREYSIYRRGFENIIFGNITVPAFKIRLIHSDMPTTLEVMTYFM